MFFSWYLKNKHFKQRGNLRGQIAPFLLVTLVILLVAAISTINIGRVSLDKTAANNSADAGALASASAYAGALNSLASMNETILWLTYQMNRVVMYDLYNEADEIIDLAMIYGATSLALALAGYYVVQASEPVCPEAFNFGYLIAMALYIASAAVCVLAAAEVSKFVVVCSYMRSIVDNHYDTQKTNYQSICESMQESVTSSRNIGYSYNFNNSNMYSKLSTSQGDQLSAWFSSEGYTSGSYSWQDKTTPTHTGQTHTVKASVDVPGISSYELQKTVNSYTKEGDLIDDMISIGNIIIIIFNVEAMLLWVAAGWLAGMTVLSLISFISFWIGDALLCCVATIPAGLAWIAYAIAECVYLWGMWGWCVGLSIMIVGNLMLLVGVGAGVTLWFLKDSLLQAYEGFFMNGTYSSSGCGDVDDILMVKISSITLPTWETTSCGEQIHPGTNIAILDTVYPTTKSCARATFDKSGIGGGAIGDFVQEYSSELTSAY